MRISDERYTKDIRRYELARRMVEHEARTMTVAAWTGLSRYRIQTLFREYEGIGAHTRPRGIPPFQPSFFSRSLDVACETLALARIQMDMQIILEGSAQDDISLPNLTRGERLVDAFELYRHLVQTPRISLEHALLLAKELAIGRAIRLSRCDLCNGVHVVDLLGTVHEQCAFCRFELR